VAPIIAADLTAPSTSSISDLSKEKRTSGIEKNTPELAAPVDHFESREKGERRVPSLREVRRISGVS